MKISEKPSLRSLNTFGVEASAALRFDIECEEDILALPGFDPRQDLILGGGSNVLLVSDVPGNVLINRIMGRTIVKQTRDSVILDAGAGENWHEFVGWCVNQGFSGLENLALIPGSAGAAPVQNIGAYGVELASRLVSVTAWDWHKQAWRVFSLDECRFGYRDSRFKSSDPDRFLITSVRLQLEKSFHPRLDYHGLKEELFATGANQPSARDVFEAVIRIRQQKLPDPGKIGNAGSFFKNPVVSASKADEIQQKFTDLPGWKAENGQIKLSAAWMIEECGLKGYTHGPAGVSPLHSLVLVNHGGASGQQILSLAREVQERVQARFDVELEPEPRIINLG